MKEKFLKSTFILIIGSFFVKILGMIIKMIMARMVGTTGLGLYMLVLPTFLLFINLSQFGMPLALAKMIAEEKKNNKKLFFSVLPILLFVNFLLMNLIFLLAPFISRTLLHNPDTYWAIMAMAFVLPFTSISSICRSYFFGKQQMFPHVLSCIVEDIVRLGIIIIGVPYLLPFGLKYTVCFLVLSNVISEMFSTLILLFFFPKNIQIKRQDFKPNKTYIKESLSIGIPNTTSRMIGSIGFFLEPILLTYGLLKVGYSTTYITTEYGIISGYVMPLILLPSFFTLAISQALLPILSKDYAHDDYYGMIKKTNLAIFLSLGIAIPITILFCLYPQFFLRVIYHTDSGASYIRFLAPICLLEYLQAPLSSVLDALGKTKDNMISSLIGMFTRTILLFSLSLLKIGFYSFLIAISMNIFCTTIYQILKIKKYLTKSSS